MHWRKRNIYRVPDGYEFPGMTLIKLISNWCTGNATKNIALFLFLKGWGFNYKRLECFKYVKDDEFSGIMRST